MRPHCNGRAAYQRRSPEPPSRRESVTEAHLGDVGGDRWPSRLPPGALADSDGETAGRAAAIVDGSAPSDSAATTFVAQGLRAKLPR